MVHEYLFADLVQLKLIEILKHFAAFFLFQSYHSFLHKVNLLLNLCLVHSHSTLENFLGSVPFHWYRRPEKRTPCQWIGASQCDSALTKTLHLLNWSEGERGPNSVLVLYLCMVHSKRFVLLYVAGQRLHRIDHFVRFLQRCRPISQTVMGSYRVHRNRVRVNEMDASTLTIALCRPLISAPRFYFSRRPVDAHTDIWCIHYNDWANCRRHTTFHHRRHRIRLYLLVALVAETTEMQTLCFGQLRWWSVVQRQDLKRQKQIYCFILKWVSVVCNRTQEMIVKFSCVNLRFGHGIIIEWKHKLIIWLRCKQVRFADRCWTSIH